MKKILFISLLLPFLFSSCSNAGEDVVSMKVASEKRWMADGAGHFEGYIVKEEGSDEWMYFYENIEGFNYEPGYEYEIMVVKKPFEDWEKIADAPRWTYTLKKVVSKTRKDSENMPPEIPRHL